MCSLQQNMQAEAPRMIKDQHDKQKGGIRYQEEQPNLKFDEARTPL